MQPSKQAAHRLAELALGRISYDVFMADLMQQVVVEEEPLVLALQRLIDDPDLRRRLGRNGQKLASEQFDWKVVVQRIRYLSDELDAQRTEATDPSALASLSPSPWKQFSSWASVHQSQFPSIIVNPARLRQRMADQANLELYSRFSIAAEPALQMVALEPLTELLIERTTMSSSSRTFGFEELTMILSDIDPQKLLHALSWLAKIGALELNV